MSRLKPQILTGNEAAELAGVAEEVVADWVADGAIPYVTLLDGTVRIPMHAFLAALPEVTA